MSQISMSSLLCWSLVLLAVICVVNTSPYYKYPERAIHGKVDGRVDAYRDPHNPNVVQVQGCFDSNSDDYIPLLDPNSPAYDPKNPAINPYDKKFNPNNPIWQKLLKVNHTQLQGCHKHAYSGLLAEATQLIDDVVGALAGK